MKQVLILGAGKSSGTLIKYLAHHADTLELSVSVADVDTKMLQQKTAGLHNVKAVHFSGELSELESLFSEVFLVVSMLPPSLHPSVAVLCLKYGAHLITPSYMSEAMSVMHSDAEKRGLLFLNEMGLDPGIDHISAMLIFDRLKNEGYQITEFRSHCGGLVAPESDDNLWHYKFSWNPRNVIMAGQGEPVRFLQDGREVVVAYKQLFATATKVVTANGAVFESYPNRNSLQYAAVYGLDSLKTLYRGTLRQPPFCSGWNVLIALGFTSATKLLSFEDSFSPYEVLLHLNPQFSKNYFLKETINLIEEAGLFDTQKVFSPGTYSPADILQKLLEEKWRMKPTDRDRVVMIHEVCAEHNEQSKHLVATLDLCGDVGGESAMSKTVGLPIALSIRLLLADEIKARGVVLPVLEDIYRPVMMMLEKEGVVFQENEP